MTSSCESALDDKVISSITTAFSKYLYEHSINVNFFRGFIAAVTPKGVQLNGIFEYLIYASTKDFRLNSRIINALIAIIEPSLRTKICNDCITLVGTTEFVSQIKFNSYVYTACSMCKNCIQLYHQDHLLPDSSMHDGIANGLLIVYSQILKPIVPEPLLSIPSKFNIFGLDGIKYSHDIVVPSCDFNWYSDSCDDYYDDYDDYCGNCSISVEQTDGSILKCALYNYHSNDDGPYYWLIFTQKNSAGVNKTLGIMRWHTVDQKTPHSYIHDAFKDASIIFGESNDCDAYIHAEFEDTTITFGKTSANDDRISLHRTYCWRVLCFIGQLLSQGGKFVSQSTGLCIVNHAGQSVMKISGSFVECSRFHPSYYTGIFLYNELWLTSYVPDNQTHSISILKPTGSVHNEYVPPFLDNLIVKARSAKAEASCFHHVSATRLAWVSSVVRLASTRTYEI